MDVFEIVKDVADTVLTGLLVWVSFKALNAWRDELHGRRKVEAATELIRTAYDLRRAFHGVRILSPLTDEERELAADEKFRESAGEVVTARIKMLDEVESEFEMACSVANVVLGPRIEKPVNKIQLAYIRLEVIARLHAAQSRGVEPDEFLSLAVSKDEFLARFSNEQAVGFLLCGHVTDDELGRLVETGIRELEHAVVAYVR